MMTELAVDHRRRSRCAASAGLVQPDQRAAEFGHLGTRRYDVIQDGQ
jgi:hypothetical protein